MRIWTCLGFALALTCAAPEALAQARGAAVMLNPQPLPPRMAGFLNPGQEAMLNPQPLPPDPPPNERSFLNAGDAVSLNPQPLPPRLAGRLHMGDDVMLNPQPLPPRWRALRVNKSAP